MILTVALILGLARTEQPAAAQAFDQMPGLQRLVVRAWTSPPYATPGVGQDSGASFVSLGVFQFDSAENAQTAYTRFATMISDSAGVDPLMAGAKPEPVDGAGDESSALIGNRTEKGIALSNVYAVARQDTYVYLLQGAMVRVDAKSEVQKVFNGAVSTPAGSAPEALVVEGTSSGGLWEKMNAASPTLIPGSTAFDSIIFPEPTVAPITPTATP